MSQISLTASMRSNLLSLQGTSSLMSQTQERLATGKKVNSAIDNPSSYYTAQSLSNRANDLSSLLDSMGQAISTIKAADEGITSITSYVEQAKAVASSALDTTDVSARSKYKAQFNAILEQIDKLAADSGYKGINLLTSTTSKLKVTFNEGRDNYLEISGVNATTAAAGLDIGSAAWGGTGTDSASVELEHTDVGTDGKVAVGSTVAANGYFHIGSVYYKYTGTEVTAGNTVDMTKAQELIKEGDGKYYNYADPTAVTGTVAKINDSIDDVTAAITKLRTYASDFGNNYAIVETRESFTKNLINVLEEGADKLTLADMNEESANMLALQTRQQLAINSLSLASQAAQSVLRLFS